MLSVDEFRREITELRCEIIQLRAVVEAVAPGFDRDSQSLSVNMSQLYPLPPGKAWAWMGGADRPRWEIVGTGAVLDPELAREHRARRLCGDYPAPCNCDDPVTHNGH